jgi:hypothetical protein
MKEKDGESRLAGGAIVYVQHRYLCSNRTINQLTPNYHFSLNIIALRGQSKRHLHFE